MCLSHCLDCQTVLSAKPPALPRGWTIAMQYLKFNLMAQTCSPCRNLGIHFSTELLSVVGSGKYDTEFSSRLYRKEKRGRASWSVPQERNFSSKRRRR